MKPKKSKKKITTDSKAMESNAMLNEVGGAIKWEDILKKGAKLRVRKLTKKEIEKLNTHKKKMEEFFKQINRPLTWEELHTPMTI